MFYTALIEAGFICVNLCVQWAMIFAFQDFFSPQVTQINTDENPPKDICPRRSKKGCGLELPWKPSRLGYPENLLNGGDTLQDFLDPVLVERGHPRRYRFLFQLVGVIGFQYHLLEFIV